MRFLIRGRGGRLDTPQASRTLLNIASMFCTWDLPESNLSRATVASHLRSATTLGIAGLADQQVDQHGNTKAWSHFSEMLGNGSAGINHERTARHRRICTRFKVDNVLANLACGPDPD